MNKDKIIVVGCGEQARVTIDNIEEQNKYDIFGLTTFNGNENKKDKVYGYEVVCEDKDIKQLIKENLDIKGYVLGLGIGVGGNLLNRYKLYSWLDKIINPVNIIHPSAVISKRAKIGKGNVIEAFTKLCNGSEVNNHCLIQSFSSVSHDQIIANNVMIACNVSLAGKTIGEHSIIAEGSSIGFKKNVGQNCLLMDGAVLTKDMPDNTVGYGNPAKIIKKNDSIIKSIYTSKYKI